MGKLGVVFRREYLERVRSRWFLIGTVLGPVFFGMITIFPVYISLKQKPAQDLAHVVARLRSGQQPHAETGCRDCGAQTEHRGDQHAPHNTSLADGLPNEAVPRAPGFARGTTTIPFAPVAAAQPAGPPEC